MHRLLGFALPALASSASEEGIWEFRVKLLHVQKGQGPGGTRSFGQLMRLVVRAWLSCRWAYALTVFQADLEKLGASLEEMKTVRRCGYSIALNCHFYKPAVFERMTGVAWEAGGADPVGYLLQDGLWNHEDASAELCEDVTSFRSVPHPLRRLHPAGLGGWLAARLGEQGWADAAGGAAASPVELAMEALPEVCSSNVREVWDSLRPGGFAARQMIIVGCGSMSSEPTQPLLERGAGGLFLDANAREIAEARQSRLAGPHRMILNTTVTPSNVLGLLRAHAAFVREVDVLQVDIDTVDGPVVLKLLQVVTPLAVVVEMRNFVPFPLRYAFLSPDTDGLSWGGASLAYWMHELGLRGYELARMDRMDAVFLRAEARPAAERRRRLLGILACYLRNLLLEPSPSSLFAERARGTTGDWGRLQHAWMEMPPEAAAAEVWRNLTAWRADLRFSLTL